MSISVDWVMSFNRYIYVYVYLEQNLVFISSNEYCSTYLCIVEPAARSANSFS